MRWDTEWRLREQAARAVDEAVMGSDPEEPPTMDELADQLDLVRWLRWMLDIDGDLDRY